MYAIANIILGTYVPWDATGMRKVAVALVTADPDRYRDVEGGETIEQVIEAAQADEVEVFDDEPWHKEYHGGASCPPIWVGVKIGEFDETNHVSLAQLRPIPTIEQMTEAGNAYAALPDSVKLLLPPLSIYIVWSSS